MEQICNRSIYQINTRVWLHELSEELGHQATLAEIPDSRLDLFASLGFGWVWFLGAWKTGAAGQRVSATNPGWRQAYEETLGTDLRDEDICGSPFAIKEYVVHPDFGGNEALRLLRDRLRNRGLRLLLDFVPNHTALDHPWVSEHPEFYINGTESNLANEPYNYCAVETVTGPRVLAYGRDPNYSGWPDTLQLNYRHPDLREAMRGQLAQIAEICDGVRCDMAMLILPEIFNRTWGALSRPPDGVGPVDSAFWPEAIPFVRRRRPDFIFVAEAYWDLEWTLQQQGFDYTYDKRLYDLLADHHANAETIRGHLLADIDYQRKLVRFLENHDEPRAAGTFFPKKHRAAAVLAFMAPGLRLFHEGQLEGRKIKVSIHLARRPVESVDQEVKQIYDDLMQCLASPEVQRGRWQLPGCRSAWDGNPSWKQFIAFSWEGQNGERLLAVVNYAPGWGQCYVDLPFSDLRGKRFRLRDLLGSSTYEHHGDDLATRGLYVDMPEWGCHVFEFQGI